MSPAEPLLFFPSFFPHRCPRHTALEPHISKATLEVHHDKHHAKYVTVTNEMIAGTEMENDDVETIIMKAQTASAAAAALRHLREASRPA